MYHQILLITPVLKICVGSSVQYIIGESGYGVSTLIGDTAQFGCITIDLVSTVDLTPVIRALELFTLAPNKLI